VIQYAVPSRGRALACGARTLTALRRVGVEPEAVTLFVADDEREAYQTLYRAQGYRFGRQPGDCLATARRAIHDHYPAGARIVCLDDDVTVIAQLHQAQLVAATPASWAVVVHTALQACADSGARLWGTYPSANAFYMSHRVRVGLWFCIGSLWGCINDPADEAFHVELDLKEDYERTLRCYLAHGAVVRLDDVCGKTKVYAGGSGGLTPHRTVAKQDQEVEMLMQRYPGFVRRAPHRKSGYPEVQLVRPHRQVVA
jgi:hypothetical protein